MLSERLNEQNQKALRVLQAPNEVALDVSTMCNYKCYFCSHHKMTRAKSFMKFTDAQRILYELYNSGIRRLGINGCGEPVLNEDVANIIAEAKKIGFEYVYLTSNGSVGTDTRYREIIDAGVDSIKISINAANPQEYAKIHGVPESFYAKITQRLNALAKYRTQNNFSTKIYASCVSDDGIEDIKILQEAMPLVDEIVHYKIVSQAGQTDAELLEGKVARKKCNLPFTRSHITVEGYVNACCADFQNLLVMGDLAKQSFLEIWHGQAYTELREKLLCDGGIGRICHGCLTNSHQKAKPTLPGFASFPQI